MLWLYSGFILFVIAMLALDLGVFHRKAHVVDLRESLVWSAVWVALSLAFTIPLYFIYAHDVGGILSAHASIADASTQYPDDARDAVVMYLTGYLTEKSLSIDNIFVIALVFSLFQIPDRYQHRVLFWGILGAIVMRGIFIFGAVGLLAKFHWLIYVFGAFLLFTAIKLLFSGEPDPSKSWAVKLCYKLLPITNTLHGQKFYVKRSELGIDEDTSGHAPLQDEDTAAQVPADEQVDRDLPADAAGASDVVAHEPDHAPPQAHEKHVTDLPDHTKTHKAAYYLTPLGLALIVVEITDLLFAVDSIPAIMGITRDPFLVFTSNIFAILGLRALYFALSGIIRKFHYLDTALAIVLGYIGVKMLLIDFIHKVGWLNEYLPYITLGVITLTLTGGIILSLLRPEETTEKEEKVIEETKRDADKDEKTAGA